MHILAAARGKVRGLAAVIHILIVGDISYILSGTSMPKSPIPDLITFGLGLVMASS